MTWVYHDGRLTFVIDEYNDVGRLAEMYPDAIYFEAGAADLADHVIHDQ